MNSADFYDKDYFMNGIKTGKSMYENYSWKPEISFPIATLLKKLYPGKSILDYGCGMGGVVKALRELNVNAYGYDESDFAIEYSFCQGYCRRVQKGCEVIFCKDVLEHIGREDIYNTIRTQENGASEAFVIIPLGNNGKWRIPEMKKDKSHVTAENEGWWIREFTRAGWKVTGFEYEFAHLKQNWIQKYPKGYGFFWLEK
jgi:SAM-dependent methyltransferase